MEGGEIEPQTCYDKWEEISNLLIHMFALASCIDHYALFGII